jgi:hypothetical protein
MPAPTRARLADLDLQGLDPKKKYTRVGKDGLLAQANEKEKLQAAVEPVVEKKEDLNVVEKVEVVPSLPVLEKVEAQNLETVAAESSEETAVQPPSVLQDLEEKKENKMFLKKQQKKSFTAP